jgi:hypothetical protein
MHAHTECAEQLEQYLTGFSAPIGMIAAIVRTLSEVRLFMFPFIFLLFFGMRRVNNCLTDPVGCALQLAAVGGDAGVAAFAAWGSGLVRQCEDRAASFAFDPLNAAHADDAILARALFTLGAGAFFCNLFMWSMRRFVFRSKG